MSLIALKQHMVATKVATLTQLCALFKRDRDTMRCLLGHWMKKGCIKRCEVASGCGSPCNACPYACTEIYEWCAPHLSSPTSM